jgi:hypothetical protein
VVGGALKTIQTELGMSNFLLSRAAYFLMKRKEATQQAELIFQPGLSTAV